MSDKIPYDTIFACKTGNAEALRIILKHYEPLIVEASKRFTTGPDGMPTVYVDMDLKEYIESELAVKIMLKYDLTRRPRNCCKS